MCLRGRGGGEVVRLLTASPGPADASSPHGTCSRVHVVWCMSSCACGMVHVVWCMSSCACGMVHVVWCMSSCACCMVHVNFMCMLHGACHHVYRV